MYISDYLLDLVIKCVRVEYNGTHNSDRENPLWGRRAYWRVYMPSYGFACKITAPVRSIKPKQATLDRLFREELKRRFEAIHECVETDHYGQVQVVWRDPYSVRKLLEVVEGKFYWLIERDLERQAAKSKVAS